MAKLCLKTMSTILAWIAMVCATTDGLHLFLHFIVVFSQIASALAFNSTAKMLVFTRTFSKYTCAYLLCTLLPFSTWCNIAANPPPSSTCWLEWYHRRISNGIKNDRKRPKKRREVVTINAVGRLATIICLFSCFSGTLTFSAASRFCALTEYLHHLSSALPSMMRTTPPH